MIPILFQKDFWFHKLLPFFQMTCSSVNPMFDEVDDGAQFDFIDNLGYDYLGGSPKLDLEFLDSGVSQESEIGQEIKTADENQSEIPEFRATFYQGKFGTTSGTIK